MADRTVLLLPRRRHWLPLVGLLGAVALVVVGGTAIAKGFPGGGSQTSQYRTALVSSGTVRQTLSLSGTAARVGEVTVGWPMSGTVATVDVSVGQQVTAGQQLATHGHGVAAAGGPRRAGAGRPGAGDPGQRRERSGQRFRRRELFEPIEHVELVRWPQLVREWRIGADGVDDPRWQWRHWRRRCADRHERTESGKRKGRPGRAGCRVRVCALVRHVGQRASRPPPRRRARPPRSRPHRLDRRREPEETATTSTSSSTTTRPAQAPRHRPAQAPRHSRLRRPRPQTR